MDFNFETLGESRTDDELAISQSLKEFGRILRDIEEERMKIVIKDLICYLAHELIFELIHLLC